MKNKVKITGIIVTIILFVLSIAVYFGRSNNTEDTEETTPSVEDTSCTSYSEIETEPDTETDFVENESSETTEDMTTTEELTTTAEETDVEEEATASEIGTLETEETEDETDTTASNDNSQTQEETTTIAVIPETQPIATEVQTTVVETIAVPEPTSTIAETSTVETTTQPQTTETPRPVETTTAQVAVVPETTTMVPETTISSFLTLPADGTYLREVAEGFFVEQNKDRQSLGVNQLQWDEDLYQMACNCAKAVAEAIADGAPMDNGLHAYSEPYSKRTITGVSGISYEVYASENLAQCNYEVKETMVWLLMTGLRDSPAHYDRAMSDYFDQGATAIYYYKGIAVSSTLFWNSQEYLNW